MSWLGQLVTDYRIGNTKRRLKSSLAAHPEDLDGRDPLWQRLHGLQSKRDAS